MSRLNVELARIIPDNAILVQHPNRGAVLGALNAILAAGCADADAHNRFRQAIIGQRVFWNSLFLDAGAQIHEGADASSIDFLNPAGEGPNSSFQHLTSFAANQRVLLAMQSATDAQLEAIINAAGANDRRKALFNNDGTSIFGEPSVTVANWNPEDEAILSNAMVDGIRIEAQRQLLLRKIAEYNKPDAETKLNSLLYCEDQDEFTRLVREFFGQAPDAPYPIADGMQLDAVRADPVTEAAAKKSFGLYINRLPADIILDNGFDSLNEDDPARFKAQFNPVMPAQHLANRDINAIKTILGTRLLSLRVQQMGAGNIAQMERVAVSERPEIAADLLKGFDEFLGGGTGDYIGHVVEASLPEIRAAFAAQALKLKIAQCDDVETLDALIAVNTVDELKAKLASNSKLGYQDMPKFLDAITAGFDLSAVIAAAHIRRNISFSDKSEHLRELIALADPALFKAKYDERFAAGTTAQVTAAIHRHFDNQENIKQARKQALVSYAKTAMSNLGGDRLDALINAGNAEIVRANTQYLFPDRLAIADDLVDRPQPHDSGVSKELRIYAAIEGMIRFAKGYRQDLSTAHDGRHADLLDMINNFQFQGQYGVLLRAAEFPATEKPKIQAHLVEALLRNYPKDRLGLPIAPPAVDKLTELAKETDLTKFKQLLTDKFGVASAWVDEQAMKQMQKAAFIRALQLGENQSLRFGPEAHPALFALVTALPLAKQQALLAKPEILTALAGAPHKTEVARILGDKNLVDAALIDTLVNENNHLGNFANIMNSEIANVLLNIQPPIDLNKRVRDSINRTLLSENIESDDDYIDAVQSIADLFRDREEELYEAFGLNADGDNIQNDDIVDKVKDQHDRNMHLIAKYQSDISPESKMIIQGLLPLSKNAPLQTVHIFTGAGNAGIVSDIKTSKTLTEFLNLAKTRPYASIFDPSLEKQLTPQAFEQLKVQARLKSLVHPGHYKKALEQQKVAIDAIDQQLSEMFLQGGDRGKLRRLAAMNPIYWFNPAFHAAAKQNAATMGPQLRDLAKQCDTYVSYLTNQQRLLQSQLDSLPSAREIETGVKSSGGSRQQKDLRIQEMRRAVGERYLELTALKDKISEELADYKNLQAVFNGRPDDDNSTHPLVRQGLLKTLDQAVAGKADIRIQSFGGHYVDCDNSTKEAHLAANWAGENMPEAQRQRNAVMEAEGSDDSFDIVPAIPEGKFREHTVVFSERGTEIKGLYIEERASKDISGQIKPDGTVNYEPSIKLTATKFPPATKPEARMYFAMAMASQMLASLKAAPTAENPIRLRGVDPEQLRYLWTALMIIGDSDKNMKFGKDAIKVISAQFDPNSELSLGGYRWNANALYHKFKESKQFEALSSGIKEVNEKKFSADQVEDREQAMEDTSELTGFFKQKMSKITEENKKHDDTFGASLGSQGPGH